MLSKALNANLKAIGIINKVGRQVCSIHEVPSEIDCKLNNLNFPVPLSSNPDNTIDLIHIFMFMHFIRQIF